MSDIKYIFKPFNGKENKVYFTSDGLCNHIKHFDFLRKYDTDGRAYDVSRGTEKRFALSAEVIFDFELGLKIPCVFGDNPNSDFIFYIGEKVEQIPNSDKIKVTVPHFPAKLSEELHEIYTIDKNNYVINNKTLEQIHPACGRGENSRLDQFIKTVTYSKTRLDRVK
jgi:hypothetical protein